VRKEAKKACLLKDQNTQSQAEETLKRSRHIPQEIQDLVYLRDQGQCAFESPDGTRCGARGNLHFDHYPIPFGKGGSHQPDNIRLSCKLHNLYMAEQSYGKEFMAQFRNSDSAGD